LILANTLLKTKVLFDRITRCRTLDGGSKIGIDDEVRR
jgi:hypothetical protein